MLARLTAGAPKQRFHRDRSSLLPRRLRWVIGLLLLLPAGIAWAAPTRNEVQAALVYKFAQFVQWNLPPEAAGTTVVVGLLGSDKVQPALGATLRAKRLHGSPLEIRTFRRPEDVRGCSILVIDVPESRRELVLQHLPDRGLLTIGEGASFARQGGVIAMMLDGPRVEFDVNLAAAERAGLTIDSALLGLARQAGRW